MLASGSKSGYSYTYTPGAADSSGVINSFQINSNPISPGITGNRYFYTDESGVIRQNTSTLASVSDTPIE